MDGPFPILTTQDLDAAVAFYTGSLGMTCVMQNDMVAMVTSDNARLLLSKGDHDAPPHTVAGWGVLDIHAEVARLREAGVAFDDFGFPSEDGVVTLGDTKLAWFRDPTGNILSLSQWPGP